MATADDILANMISDPRIVSEAVAESAPEVDGIGQPINYMSPTDTLPDISHIDVGQFFLNEVLHEGKEQPKAREKVQTSPKQISEDHYILTQDELNVLTEAGSIISKLTEATTVGCIGVNMAGPQKEPEAKKKKKKGEKEDATKRLTKVSNRPDNSSFLSYLGKIK